MNTNIAPGLAHLLKLNRENETNKSSAQEQVAARPDIDDVICHCLEGGALKDALFIIDNIRENKMKIKWSSVNVWSVRYKRKHVCYLSIKNNALNIGKVNGVLSIRVTDMSYDAESLKRLIKSLRDSIACMQEAEYALT